MEPPAVGGRLSVVMGPVAGVLGTLSLFAVTTGACCARMVASGRPGWVRPKLVFTMGEERRYVATQ